MTSAWLAQLGVSRKTAYRIPAFVGPFEIVLGLLALAGFAPVATAGVMAALGCLFVALHLRGQARGVTAPCACLGSSRTTRLHVSLVAACFLVIASIVAAITGDEVFLRTAGGTWSVVGAVCAFALLGSLALVEEVLFFEENRVRPIQQRPLEAA